MKAITKTEFIKRATRGIYLIDSIWSSKVNILEMVAGVLKNEDVEKHQLPSMFRRAKNKTLENLKLETSFGVPVYLQLSGENVTIYEYNGFLLVVSVYDNGKTNVVVYA